MAWAQIPPFGQMHDAQARRERLYREKYSPDPVERYRLREQRFQEGFTELGNALIRQANNNAKIYKQIKGE